LFSLVLPFYLVLFQFERLHILLLEGATLIEGVELGQGEFSHNFVIILTLGQPAPTEKLGTFLCDLIDKKNLECNNAHGMGWGQW
jgi:hypothetical protein